jgi:hypothetical protein
MKQEEKNNTTARLDSRFYGLISWAPPSVRFLATLGNPLCIPEHILLSFLTVMTQRLAKISPGLSLLPPNIPL